jgi:Arc/MetJ-type ribon-helix-helix transcriptional regulator
MALTVRLDPEMEARIAQVSKRRGVSRSEWVRAALRTQLASEGQCNAYKIYLQVMQAMGLDETRAPTGVSDLSVNQRELYGQKIRAKHRR